MYVHSVQMKNLRCYEDASVEFCVPPEPSDPSSLDNVTLLLGVNGSGKTTILRAICLAAIGDLLPLAGFSPRMYIRRDPSGQSLDSAEIVGGFSYDRQDIAKSPDVEIVTPGEVYRNALRIESTGDYEKMSLVAERELDYWKDESLTCFLLAYGVTRRTNSSGWFDSEPFRRKGARYYRISGLFEEYVPLVNLEDWTHALDEMLPGRWARMRAIMKAVFPEEIEFRLPSYPNHSQVKPSYLCNGVVLERGALSDGYKLLVGLVSDILFQIHLAMGAHDVEISKISGIVLVDDVDLLMHPSWQRTILPRLARAFPRIQFIVTTHSPLVAGSLHRRNVRVVDVDASGAPQIRAYEEPLYGLSADQILTSSYFGLDSPRSPDAVRELQRIGEEIGLKRDPQLTREFIRRLREGEAARAIEPK